MTHRRQHTIPKCYLEAWCDPAAPSTQEPYVWIISTHGASVRRRAPANLFRETDFYTLRRNNGDRDLKVEHSLGKLESSFSKVRRSTLEQGKSLGAEVRLTICLFAAAMQLRTTAARKRFLFDWRPVLEAGRALEKWAKTATAEEKKRMAGLGGPGTGKGMSIAELASIVDQPQSVLFQDVALVADILLRCSLLVVTTTTPLGYITSDNPFAWRTPVGRSATQHHCIGLPFPVSASQVILFNGQRLDGYVTSDEIDFADEVNRRTISLAEGSFVARQCEMRKEWFA